MFAHLVLIFSLRSHGEHVGGYDVSAQEEMADYEDMPAPVVERKAIVLPWMILQCILMYLGPRCVLCDELPRWLHAFYCPRCNAVLASGDVRESHSHEYVESTRAQITTV